MNRSIRGQGLAFGAIVIVSLVVLPLVCRATVCDDAVVGL